MAVTQFFDPFGMMQEGRNTDSLIASRDSQTKLTLQTIQEAVEEKERYREYMKRTSPQAGPPGQPTGPVEQKPQPTASEMIYSKIAEVDRNIQIASDLGMRKQLDTLYKERDSLLSRHALAADREAQTQSRVAEQKKEIINSVSRFASAAHEILGDETAPADKALALSELENAARTEHPEAYKVLAAGGAKINWEDPRTYARMRALEKQAVSPEKRQEMALNKLKFAEQQQRDELAREREQRMSRQTDALIAHMREGDKKPQPVTIEDPDNPGKDIVVDARTRAKIGDAPGRGKAETTLNKQVTQLQKGLEQANLPQVNAVLESADNAIKANPKILDFATGPGMARPDWTLPADIRLGRQAIEKVFNIELKNRSGAAVTVQELQRLKDEYGKGMFKTPEQLQGAIKQAQTIIAAHYRSVAAGFPPEVLQTYNDNLTAVGGKPVIDITKKADVPAPTAPPAAYSDAEKEKRYQEWKAKNAK